MERVADLAVAEVDHISVRIANHGLRSVQVWSQIQVWGCLLLQHHGVDGLLNFSTGA